MNTKVKIISIIAIFSIFTMFLSSSYRSVLSTFDDRTNETEFSALTPHGPIIITHDDNFSLYPLISGDGSALTPYRIEELSIISTVDEKSISITGTTKHFIIKNCYIQPNTTGIYLNNIAPGTAQIVDNTMEGLLWDHGYYIEIRHTNSTFIANNTFLYPEESSGAMYLYYAHHSTVFNNTAKDEYDPFPKLGYVYGYGSEYLTIANNTGTNLAGSFGSTYCPYLTIANNTLINSHDGVSFHTCPNSVIDNNYFDSTGFMAIDIIYSPSNITNNRVFNAGIRIYEEDSKEYRKYKIEDNKINNKDHGFFVDIPDLILNTGIYVQIFALNCSNILIENYDNDDINQAIVLIECLEPTVTNCMFTNCEYTGVKFDTCNDSLLVECNFIDCGQGAFLYNSLYSNVTYNNFQLQFFDALQVYVSNHSSITYNLFQQGGTGVYIDSRSTMNSIHHNTFHYSSARDDGINNTWYDPVTQQGNYWWDYSGSGNYTIPGSAKANDTYPLLVPPVPIIPEFGIPKNFTFLILVIPTIVIIPYIRKRKK